MQKLIVGPGAFVFKLALPALADGDPEKGEKVFRKCKACHTVGEGAKDKIGPALNRVYGSEAGLSATFNYSEAMRAEIARGLVWDEDTLALFLTDPREYIPGTKMSFAGLKRDGDISDVIAYLATFQ